MATQAMIHSLYKVEVSNAQFIPVCCWTVFEFKMYSFWESSHSNSLHRELMGMFLPIGIEQQLPVCCADTLEAWQHKEAGTCSYERASHCCC